jgi:hypothetical protein
MLYDVQFNATDYANSQYCSTVNVYKTEQDKADNKVAFYLINNVPFAEVEGKTAEEIMAYIKAKGDELAQQEWVIAKVNMPEITPAPLIL